MNRREFLKRGAASGTALALGAGTVVANTPAAVPAPLPPDFSAYREIIEIPDKLTVGIEPSAELARLQQQVRMFRAGLINYGFLRDEMGDA